MATPGPGVDFTFRSITIRTPDFECLREDQYLNDNVMDFYWAFLKRKLQLTNHPHASDIYFFNSHFHACLTAEKEPGTLARRWERNVHLMKKPLIFIPFNEEQHWLLFVLVRLPCAYADSPSRPPTSSRNSPLSSASACSSRRRGDTSWSRRATL